MMGFTSSRAAAITAAAAVLVLAAGACAAPSGADGETGGDSRPPVETRTAASPAPSPTPTEAQPVALGEGLRTYPDTPTVRWTASAISEGDAPGYSMFADPGFPWSLAGLYGGDSSPVDAGDVWVTAAPPALIGLDPDNGDRLWTYNPDDGFLERCSGDLIDGAIACMVGDDEWDNSTRSEMVMVDVRSGAERSSFELPAPSRAFEVTGSDIVSIMYTGPIPRPWDDTLPANPYRVTRYAADGTVVWTADVPYVWDGFVCGECMEAEATVNEDLVDALIMGQHFLLDVETGALLHYPGLNANDPYSSVLTQHGALFTTTEDQQSLVQVDVIDGDGALVTALPDHRVLRNGDGQLHLLTDDQAPFLMDADGRVVELDPVTGATTPTGVIWADDPSLADPIVRKIGDILLLQGDTSVAAHDLRQPGTPIWQSSDADIQGMVSGDGTMLYSVLAESDESIINARVTAIRLSDGSLVWSMPLEPLDTSTSEYMVPYPRLGAAGGHLVVVSGDTMTVLEP